MRPLRSVHVVVATVCILASCTEGPVAPTLVDPSLAIMDGANAGNEHFFFLPPLVPNPSTSGVFDASLSPVVTIEDLDASAQIAEFTTLTVGDDNYQVNWHTNDYDLDETHTYRISVSVDGVELGFADVDVVTSGRELQNVITGEFIALKDGRTLPIKFRIEEGALPPLVAVGETHSCAAFIDKTYCWGQNAYGQLGDGTTESNTDPVLVAGELAFEQLTSGGGFHTCGLTAAGEAYCWGRNPFGQLGDGSTSDSNVPVRAASGLTFTSIDVARYHTCGVTEGADAYCWGGYPEIRNRLPDGTIVPFGSPLGAVPEDTCLSPYGNYRGTMWPCSATPLLVSGGIEWESIRGGVFGTCGVAVGGDGYCWGWNNANQLANLTYEDSTEPVAIGRGLSFDELHNSGLYVCGRSGGTAICWGSLHPVFGIIFDYGHLGFGNDEMAAYVEDGEPRPVSTAATFRSVKPANANNIFGFTCGIDLGGQAYCWGDSRNGQLGDAAALGCTPPAENNGIECSDVPVPVATGIRFHSLDLGNQSLCGASFEGDVYCGAGITEATSALLALA